MGFLISFIILVLFVVFSVPLFILSFKNPKPAMFLWVVYIALFFGYMATFGCMLLLTDVRVVADKIMNLVFLMPLAGFVTAFIKSLINKFGTSAKKVVTETLQVKCLHCKEMIPSNINQCPICKEMLLPNNNC